MTNRWTPSLRGVQRRRNPEWRLFSIWIAASLTLLAMTGMAYAATSIPFTINTSEAVNVTGTPRIAVDVGGVTRYATYTSGSGTNALTFTYTMVAGDVDLDGVALSSPIDLNGGTIKDLNGNDATLTFTPPNTSNVKVNYPSLGMDFVADADGRYTLNGTVYNDLTSFLTAAGGTFTRASTATYFDSTGTLQTASSGTPRFDYDPITHAAKGILIEESRTNLAYPSLSGSGGWGSVALTYTLNSLTSPSGATVATTLTDNATSSLHQSYTANIAFTSGTTYTFSNYFKAGTSTIIQMSVGVAAFSTAPYINFNLVTGTISQTGGTPTSAGIENVGNGWYRCWFSATASSSASTGMGIYFTNNSPTAGRGVIYSGSGQYLYHYGAQIEQGAFPTSYIPTTTATVTRVADIFSVPTGSWFDANKGSFVAESYGEQNTTNGTGYGRIVGTNGGKSFLEQGSTLSTIETWSGTGPVLSVAISPTMSQTVAGKFAMNWNSSGTTRSIVTNGGTVSTGTYSGDYTSANIQIGSRAAVANARNAPIRKIKYYPAVVPGTQLQLLTQ